MKNSTFQLATIVFHKCEALTQLQCSSCCLFSLSCHFTLCFESIRLQSTIYFLLDIPTPLNQPLLYSILLSVDAYANNSQYKHIHITARGLLIHHIYIHSKPYTRTLLPIAIRVAFVGLRAIHFVRLFSVSKQIWCGTFVFLCVYFSQCSSHWIFNSSI